MSSAVTAVLAVVAAYLLGSGNPGATNVYRTSGRGAGLAVLVVARHHENIERLVHQGERRL